MVDSTDFSVTISNMQADVHTTSWIWRPLMNPFGLYKSLKFLGQFRGKQKFQEEDAVLSTNTAGGCLSDLSQIY